MQVLANAILNRASPLNRGLVSWWLCLPQRFQLQGGYWRDVAGQYHAINNGAKQSHAAGRLGGFGSMIFDGSTVNLSVPSSGNYDYGTVCAWIFPGNNDDQETILRLNGHAFQRSFGDPEKLRYYNGTSSVDSANDVIVESAWQHVAAVRNGTNCTLYYNGQACGSGADSTIQPGPTNIGFYSSSSHYWTGRLDDIRFFKAAKSAAEIMSIYRDSMNGYRNSLAWLSPSPGFVESIGGGGGSTIPVISHHYRQLGAAG